MLAWPSPHSSSSVGSTDRPLPSPPPPLSFHPPRAHPYNDLHSFFLLGTCFSCTATTGWLPDAFEANNTPAHHRLLTCTSSAQAARLQCLLSHDGRDMQAEVNLNHSTRQKVRQQLHIYSVKCFRTWPEADTMLLWHGRSKHGGNGWGRRN